MDLPPRDNGRLAAALGGLATVDDAGIVAEVGGAFGDLFSQSAEGVEEVRSDCGAGLDLDRRQPVAFLDQQVDLGVSGLAQEASSVTGSAG